MAAKSFTILGIDTSCDDTCASIVKIQNPKSKIQNFEILSNVVSSQVKLHAKYGGVYPFLAKREHQRNLPVVFKKAVRGENFDLIGVTVGPGLEPCLWQGINFAKDLAKKYKKPLIPVNHIEAHIIANFVGKSQISNLKSQILPAICLVVSGGHTQLILMKGIGDYELVGETRDDAAGECFDKVARILGLGYPGGPAIDAAAAKSKIQNPKSKISLPRPMLKQKNYDFSFSGLKTAVLYLVKSQISNLKSQKFIRAVAYEVQQAIIDVLIYKTIKAARDYKAKSILLGGGVVANQELREQFKKACLTPGVKYFVPPKNLCTDNAAMVAATAYFHRKEKINLEDIIANANLRV